MSQFARMLWRTGVDSLVGLISPPECVWCRQPDSSCLGICPTCRRWMVSDYYRCCKCATPLPSVIPNEDCFRCRAKGWKFDRIYTLGPYRGRRREAVILMKKPGGETLRQVAGRLLAGMLLHAVQPAQATLAEEEGKPLATPLILPVPNHWTHNFSRAANTTGSLAFALADCAGWPVNTRILRRIRKTRKQGMLAWSERVRNVRGAFEVRSAPSLTGRHVFLVDDVLTSGATAAELARLLRASGASRVDVAVVARGTGARESQPEPPPS